MVNVRGEIEGNQRNREAYMYSYRQKEIVEISSYSSG